MNQFLLLVAGHYLADFALQTQFMVEQKQNIFKTAMGFHALTAHAAIHGLVAGVITRSFTAGLIVAGAHWLIDGVRSTSVFDNKLPHTKGARKNGQTQGLFGINIDQMLHIGVLALVAFYVV